MKKPTNQSVDASYERHRAIEQEAADGPLPIVDPDSVDSWRHRRMRSFVRPLIDHFPGSTWMTVGDGRHGSDAQFLLGEGVKATATSLTCEQLRIAATEGWITDYSAENAEAIDRPDDSFDFIFCKEAYHHFPRPSVALYEMLRVSKRGVFMIEPTETGNQRLLDWTRMKVKVRLRGDETSLYEPDGNFLYRVSPRELQKSLAALGFRYMAVKRFNDFWHPSVGASPANGRSRGFLTTRLGLATQNILCSMRLMNYGLAAFLLFKETPDEALQDRLKEAGFTMFETPPNPFL